MARGNTGATSRYLSRGSAFATSYPFSVSFWMWVDLFHNYDWWWSMGQTATYRKRFGIYSAGTQDRIYFQTQPDSGGADNIIAPSNIEDTWIHVCAVVVAANDRAFYVDNTKYTSTKTATVTLGDMTDTKIGAASNPGTTEMDGWVGEYGAWNVALSDDDAAALSVGYTPDQVRPDGLVDYLPLVRGDASGNERSIWGEGVLWTETGTMTVDPHPRIISRRQRGTRHVPVAGPAGLSVPEKMLAMSKDLTPLIQR